MTYLETGADLNSSADAEEPANGAAARCESGHFYGDNRATNRGYTIEHGLGTDRVSVSLRITIGSAAPEDAHCNWLAVDEDGNPSDDKITCFPHDRWTSATRFDWLVIG